MNPADFLTLAESLAREPGEAQRRSAVSRAYYCLFHTARQLLDDCEVVCEESASAHVHMVYCLQHTQHSDAATAANRLGTFRQLRNNADYNLSDTRFSSAKFVETQLAIARTVVVQLDNSRKDLAIIRPHVRAYARDILKMRLRGGDAPAE